jgi:hypothetical protein
MESARTRSRKVRAQGIPAAEVVAAALQKLIAEVGESKAAEPRTRLRYLLALFAKEVAYRAHGVPGSEAALESLVEILAHAERNLSGIG